MIGRDRIADIGIVAFSSQNCVFAAAFQGFWLVFFRILQNTKAASECLHRISVFSDDCINQSAGAGADGRRFLLEIRYIPITIVFVFGWHIRRNHHPGLRCVAALMRPDEVAVFVINIDFFFTCLDFKFLSQIFSGHAIMDLVEGEGEILCYFNRLTFKVINNPDASIQALCSAPTSPLTALAFCSCLHKLKSGVCEFLCLYLYI